MDDQDALKMAERIVETVMARQPAGRPAFYALLEAHRAVRRAMGDLGAPPAGAEPRRAM